MSSVDDNDAILIINNIVQGLTINLENLRGKLIDSIEKKTTRNDLFSKISVLQVEIKKEIDKLLESNKSNKLVLAELDKRLQGSFIDDEIKFHRQLLKKAVDVKNTEIIQELYDNFSKKFEDKKFYFWMNEEMFTDEDKIFVLIHVDENDFFEGFDYQGTLKILIREVLKSKDKIDYLSELLHYILNSFSKREDVPKKLSSFHVFRDIINEHKFPMEYIKSKFETKYENIDDFIKYSTKINILNKRPLIALIKELSDASAPPPIDSASSPDKSSDAAAVKTADGASDNETAAPPPDKSADATNATATITGGKKKRNNKTKKRKKTRKKTKKRR